MPEANRHPIMEQVKSQGPNKCVFAPHDRVCASCAWYSDPLAARHVVGKKTYFPIFILTPGALSINSLSLPQDSNLETEVKGPHHMDYAGETIHR